MSATTVELTDEQLTAHDAIVDWVNSNPRNHLTVGGLAGTGKTTITAEVARTLRGSGKRRWRRKDARIAFCCYTGKAANVLNGKLTHHGLPAPDDYCGTIHRLIYEPRESEDGEVTVWRRRHSIDYDLIVVDEASMVSERIHDDLRSYRLPILYVGDHGQLPPIEGSLNLMAKPDIRLERIHRQAEGSPIIRLAMMARNDGYIPPGEYGEYVRKVTDWNILDRIDRPDDAMVLVGFNTTRAAFNRRVRQRIDRTWDYPVVGDRVVCLRNNADAGVFNGMTGVIDSIDENTEHTYWADITLDGERRGFSGQIAKSQFGLESTLKMVPEHSQGNKVNLWDYGYCLSVWKAQGSEHDRVVLFEQRNSYMDDDAWRRFLYTGITRARERLIVVGD